ncbi:hypothetical protein CALCODRAFT_497971 [Calocera cornea HHB12733]|uniref:Uncharacterized protein n=1 Tax=Calocera cornea HHB12733 TaxID=1353952 RepID=A0A165F0A8_9BASI|nr:hypothetical protein CALCODRAFT_497971 [Calocera cornea HHB12733]
MNEKRPRHPGERACRGGLSTSLWQFENKAWEYHHIQRPSIDGVKPSCARGKQFQEGGCVPQHRRWAPLSRYKIPVSFFILQLVYC